jgi:hypothetical protein
MINVILPSVIQLNECLLSAILVLVILPNALLSPLRILAFIIPYKHQLFE